MKVRIINGHDWYVNRVGEIFNVSRKPDGDYQVDNCPTWNFIIKQDAEVVEDVEKSCKTCVSHATDGRIGWCKVAEQSYCIKTCYCYWKPIKQTEDKFAKIEFEKEYPLIKVPAISNPKQFTRSDLTNEINQSCDDIKKLFIVKNSDYGSNEDAFANFRKTAERIVLPFMKKHGVEIECKDAMFLVLMILQDKHLVAMSQTGLKGNEVAERLGDIANYSLIAKAMLKGG